MFNATGIDAEELQDHNEIFVDTGAARVSPVTPTAQRARRGERVTVSVDVSHPLIFPDDEERNFE